MVMLWVLLIHKVLLYIVRTTEYVHSSEFGLSHPLSRHSPTGEGLGGGGGGGPNSGDWRKA